MKYKVVKFTKMSPLHIGAGRENYDTSSSMLQSDTLSAALASLRAKKDKGDETEAFLNSFAVSSALPYAGDKFFLPLPKGRKNITINGQEEKQYRKSLKKLQYADIATWAKLMNGMNLAIEQGQIQHKSFLTSDAVSIPEISKKQVLQRVSVSRCGDDAVPFFFEWEYFNKDCGMYCIVDADEKPFDEIFSLFEELGEEGIGTDKSVGGGKFKAEKAEIELPDIADVNAQISLGLYLPSKEELDSIDLNNSHYSLLLRGGFMAGSSDIALRHLRKKSVYMFDVGSVFHTVFPIKGKTVCLTPDWDAPIHPVFRSGKPIIIPIKANL